ncbi:MAG TPA: type II toxin-antitoxin system prevent-host-death family antitoxin [Micromonosporaceae bacterium]|nr:type II toxin-antitoxin system prevent-host-death family antitoxin [Micromonosporaceae bacterium]
MVKRVLLGIQELRLRLRERVNAVEDGEHTVFARRGKPIAVLVPIAWYRDAARALNDPTEY